MGWTDWLAVGANVAQAATGVVAVWLWVKYIWRARERRIELENYLKEQKRADDGRERIYPHGRRPVLHLMGNLAMTETQVLEAAFSSSTVKRSLATDPNTGRAETIYFTYDDKA
jgi:hypothetical protein